MASLVFDATTIEIDDRPSFGLLPKDNYTVVIVEADYRETKKRNGHMLAITLEVTKGEHTGRRLWENLNLDNPSQQAVKMAQQDLAQILMATGLGRMQDTSELLYKEIVVAVRIKPATADRSEENVIDAYLAPAGAAPVAPAAPAPVAQEAFVDDIPGGAPAKPWEQ